MDRTILEKFLARQFRSVMPIRLRPPNWGVLLALLIWAWLLAVFWNRIGGDPAIYFNFSKHFFSKPFSYFDGGQVLWGATGPLTVVVYAFSFGNWQVLNLIVCVLLGLTVSLLGRLGRIRILQSTLALICFPALTFSSLNKFESLVWFPLLIFYMLSAHRSWLRCFLAGLLPLVRPELLVISLHEAFLTSHRKKPVIVVPLIVFWSYMFASTGTAIPTSIGERIFRYLPGGATRQDNLEGLQPDVESSLSSLATSPSIFRGLDLWNNLSIRALTALHLVALAVVIWRKFGSKSVTWFSRFLPLMALYALAHASRTAYLAVPEGLTLAFCVKHCGTPTWPRLPRLEDSKVRRSMLQSAALLVLVSVGVAVGLGMAIFNRWYPQDNGRPAVPFDVQLSRESKLMPYERTMGYDLAETLANLIPEGEKVLIYEIGMQAASPREMISLDGSVARDFRPLTSAAISDRIREAEWFVSTRGCGREAFRGTLIGAICERKGEWRVGDTVEDSTNSLRVVAVNESFDESALWDTLWQRGTP